MPYNVHRVEGSAFTLLTRSFVEHWILGADSLPRTLLMYLSNTPSSITNYFESVLCNSCQFKWTVIDHNLQYAAFDPKGKPRELSDSDFDAMIANGAAFALHVGSEGSDSDQIDHLILKRSSHGPV
ncbi:hypothetical protein CRG98_032793 [Punica granatum]|uniref:Uncharacterized protein n=1 Tax=Punica granatum TaxID=22663 RepID=A0A2I0ITQ8_PUNGR|nr:hypothetical protein CRG98_032793 [Punica granatum]